MKKILLLAPVLALAACAPTAGIPPVKYVGQSSDVIAAIAQICSQTQASKAYNYYTVDGISNNGVTCVASPVLGFQLFGVNQPIRVTFTALQNGNTVNVAGSANGDGRKLVDDVFQQLDKTFKRAP